MARAIDIVQVKREIQAGKLAVEFKDSDVLLTDKQSGEAYLASNDAWMRHDGFPWKVDCWMPMPDRRPPEGEANGTK